jgi:DNA-binding Lrp family transcriptional regulator
VSFALEKDLVDVLRRATPCVFSSEAPPRGCAVFDQFQVYASGVRVPDILLVYHSKAASRERSLTYYEASVLAALYANAPTTLADIAASMFCEPSDVLERIRALRRRRLVVQIGEHFSLSPRAFPMGVRVIAIEAKLKDWRRAIEQAKSYLDFAHESYVAMPSGIAQRSVLTAACAAVGVGLLAVDAGGNVSCVLRSSATPILGAEYLRLLSRTIGLTRQ